MKITEGLEKIERTLGEALPGHIKIHDVVFRDREMGVFGPFGYSFVLGIPEQRLMMGACLKDKTDKRTTKKYAKQIMAIFNKDRKCLNYL
jgi:hypothetical protein